MSIKDKIIAAQDRKFQDVPVPEWDCTVRVQAMTGDDLFTFYNEVSDDKGNVKLDGKTAMPKLLVRTLYDPETGERLFESGETGLIGGKSGDVLFRLFRVAQDVNGLSKAAVEDIEKK